MVLAEIEDKKKCFELRGSLFPLSVLELTQNNVDSLDEDIKDLIKQAPKFFQNIPIVLDVYKMGGTDLDLVKIRATLKENNLLLIGLRGAQEPLKLKGISLGIPSVSKSRTNEPTIATRQIKKETVIQVAENKIWDKPIRSGQQIYAKDGDLIVLSSVSEGAEILADGNIHIYGTLRGRALAGVQGNKEARIFCQSLDAELISIAGIYTTKETYIKNKEASQIRLIENRLEFSSL